MNTVVIIAFVCSSIALIEVNAQCSTSTNSNCANWVNNGFCNNPGYTTAQKQAYCGVQCGLCTATGTPITPGSTCSDANANCVYWVANGFCTNPGYTQAQKTAYCCGSCSGTTTTTGSTTTATTGSTTTSVSTTTTP